MFSGAWGKRGVGQGREGVQLPDSLKCFSLAMFQDIIFGQNGERWSPKEHGIELVI